jgi:hypothetical protein
MYYSLPKWKTRYVVRLSSRPRNKLIYALESNNERPTRIRFDRPCEMDHDKRHVWPISLEKEVLPDFRIIRQWATCDAVERMSLADFPIQLGNDRWPDVAVHRSAEGKCNVFICYWLPW